MKRLLPLSLLLIVFTGCATTPESYKAAEDTAWDLSYIIENRSALTVAVGTFETRDVPEALDSTFHNDLSTYLATAFSETGSDHRVVTRDRMGDILAEQEMDLAGLNFREAQLQVGQLLGADVLVTGTLIWLEDDYYRSSAQMIEIATGVVLGGSSWDFWFDTESGR